MAGRYCSWRQRSGFDTLKSYFLLNSQLRVLMHTKWWILNFMAKSKVTSMGTFPVDISMLKEKIWNKYLKISWKVLRLMTSHWHPSWWRHTGRLTSHKIINYRVTSPSNHCCQINIIVRERTGKTLNRCIVMRICWHHCINLIKS